MATETVKDDEVVAPGPAVVLVRPREEGNVGATARAMANMGLSRLIVVEPGARFGPTARAFAVGAAPLLDRAERQPSLAAALAPFALAVGTTSSRDRLDRRPVLTARELPAALAASGVPAANVALVFGPEISGLDNEELATCGLLVSVPCAPALPTLNLGQAVLVVTYELWLATGEAPVREAGASPRDGWAVAPQAEVEALAERADALLVAGGFARDQSFIGVRRDLRALAARAALTTREVALLSGVVRRLGHALRLSGD
jgi:TrmH family RNA methyltransferase